MRRIFKILLLTIALNAAAKYAAAQTDVPVILQTLEDLYSAGKYEQLLQLSQSLHDSARLSKDQNLQRLKYTVAAYKDFGYRREADSVARLFYQRDPFYDIQKGDPLPFREVLGNYYTMPIFSAWMAGGMHFVRPVLKTIRPLLDAVSVEPEYDVRGNSLQIGFEYRPLRKLSVSVAPTYVKYEMERKMRRTNLATFHYNESCKTFALPLAVEAWLYVFGDKFVPSVYGGAQFKYILGTKSNAYTDAIGTYTEVPDKKDDTKFKNRTNYSVLGGARFNYTHRRITFFIDFGVSYDLKPYNDPDKKFDDRALMYQSLYIRDVFQLLEYTVKLGAKVNLQYNTFAKYHYGY
jgi:hypothetical protein